jgi:hypothetical protein
MTFTEQHDDARMLARRLLHGAKGIELFHMVGCGSGRILLDSDEVEIMYKLRDDGFVYQSLGDWFLTQRGLKIWYTLFVEKNDDNSYICNV